MAWKENEAPSSNRLPPANGREAQRRDLTLLKGGKKNEHQQKGKKGERKLDERGKIDFLSYAYERKKKKRLT